MTIEELKDEYQKEIYGYMKDMARLVVPEIDKEEYGTAFEIFCAMMAPAAKWPFRKEAYDENIPLWYEMGKLNLNDKQFMYALIWLHYAADSKFHHCYKSSMTDGEQAQSVINYLQDATHSIVVKSSTNRNIEINSLQVLSVMRKSLEKALPKLGNHRDYRTDMAPSCEQASLSEIISWMAQCLLRFIEYEHREDIEKNGKKYERPLKSVCLILNYSMHLGKGNRRNYSPLTPRRLKGLFKSYPTPGDKYLSAKYHI